MQQVLRHAAQQPPGQDAAGLGEWRAVELLQGAGGGGGGALAARARALPKIPNFI